MLNPLTCQLRLRVNTLKANVDPELIDDEKTLRVNEFYH